MNFAHCLKIEGEDIVFSFTKVICPEGTKFFITTTSADNTLISFEMKQDACRDWRIKDHVPHWIKSVEKELSLKLTEA